MKAEEFLTKNSDWFDKSPGGENLYFESEVIRMMNEYANEVLHIHDAVGRREQLCDCKDFRIKGKMLVCKECGKEHKNLSA